VDQVVVSSDADDPATDAVCAEAQRQFADFRYGPGPQRGLAANRNSCVRMSDADHVLFLDDDARLDPEFLAVSLPLAADDRLVTGWETRNGEKCWPREPDFLGFQRNLAADGGKAIVINSTIFPRCFLVQRPFDEFYEFGSEEVDIAFAAVARGLRIVLVDAGNEHRHVPTSRSGNDLCIFKSKLYFGVRRYTVFEPDRRRLAAFMAYGLLNGVGHEIKVNGRSSGRVALRDGVGALRAGLRNSRSGN
jgi:glycosyltransferase involved in cell wall biosynthesis